MIRTHVPPTTPARRIPIGNRITFLWGKPGHRYRMAGTVTADDGRTVTVRYVNDWSPDTILMIPKGDIVTRIRPHRTEGRR